MMWHKPGIPALKRLRQEDLESGLHSKTLSQKKERKNRKTTNKKISILEFQKD
jgi:hypothetical protein